MPQNTEIIKGGFIMKKYQMIWYDHLETKEDGIIEAIDQACAEVKAFAKYSGTPPLPNLMLKEI